MRSLFSFVLLLVVPTAWSATVFVSPAEFRGQIAEDADVTTDLIKNAVDKTKGFTRVDLKTGADVTLTARVLKLGSSYLVSLRKVGGSSAELKSPSMEEMPTTTARLVRSVLTGSDEAPRIGEVTQADRRQNDQRIEATRSWQFGFGPAWTTNLGDSGVASVWSLGYAWGIEEDFEILAMGEYLNSSKSSNVGFSGLTLGLNYFLTRTRNAPFATVNFGYAWAQAESSCEGPCLGGPSKDGVSGWELGGGLGYKFFRTSNINLGLILRHDFLMATTRGGLPSKTSLKVVLYF